MNSDVEYFMAVKESAESPYISYRPRYKIFPEDGFGKVCTSFISFALDMKVNGDILIFI